MSATAALAASSQPGRDLTSTYMRDTFEVTVATAGAAPIDIAIARARLELRLTDHQCVPVQHPIPRIKRRAAGGSAGAATIHHDNAEMVILRSLARTWPAAQFAVTTTGRIFSGYRHGNHHEHDRLYVSGLSEILDQAADLMYLLSSGRGGRLFVTSTQVQTAEGQVLATLKLCP